MTSQEPGGGPTSPRRDRRGRCQGRVRSCDICHRAVCPWSYPFRVLRVGVGQLTHLRWWVGACTQSRHTGGTRAPRRVRGRASGSGAQEPGNHFLGVNRRTDAHPARVRLRRVLCRPNPSAHLVGVGQRSSSARDRRPETCAAVATVTLCTRRPRRLACSALPPATAEPSIDDVQTGSTHLYHQAEQASERYNDAKLRLQRGRDSGSPRCSRPRPPGRRSTRPRPGRRDRGRAVPGPGALRGHPGRALRRPRRVPDQLTTISEYSAEQSAKVADLAVEVERLEMRQEVAWRRQIDEIAEAKEQLAQEKATIDDKAAEAEELLCASRRRPARSGRAAARRRVPTTAARLRQRGRRRAVRHGPGRRRLRLRRRRTRPPSTAPGLTMMAWARPASRCRTRRRRRWARAPRSPQRPAARATWCSTTAL